MRLKKNRKKGFSIPEVIIALTLVVIVIVTATDLLVSSNRANNLSIKNVIAFNLAQEALEGIRNIRDGYWMHNKNWKGEDNIFGDNFEDEGFYVINKSNDLFDYSRCENEQVDINDMALYAPWNLEKINSDPLVNNSTVIYKHSSNGNSFIYDHDSEQDAETIYRRWIEIKPIDYELPGGSTTSDLKIGVTAVVAWEEQGMVRDVRIPTILTNWKDGPL